MKIFIGTPMYGGNCKGIYVDGIINLSFKLASMGHEITYSKVTNESLITRARNSIAHQFLKSDCDVLLFIDGDHGFNADDIVKMLNSEVDLIGAIYPMKNINWDRVVTAYSNGAPIEELPLYSGFFSANLPKGNLTIKLDEPIEVVNVATGMMAIKRNVFEAMIPTCKQYANHGNTGAMDFNDKVYDFFRTEIDEEGILLSEDYYFCKKWQELGGKAYAAPWVNISHAGDYEFPGNFAKTIMLSHQVELAELEKQKESK